LSGSPIHKPRPHWLPRLLVGGGFVLAGLLKIAAPATFAESVANFRLLPGGLVNLTAILLPWLELVVGSCVLANLWTRTASLLAVGMAAIFAAAIVSALARGLNIECGCFGTLGAKRVGFASLAIDLVFFGLASHLAWRSGDNPERLNLRESWRADTRDLA